MNNWDTPIYVRVVLSATLHHHISDYHTYDDETKTLIDQTIRALQDHTENVPMVEEYFSYRVGRVIYKVQYTGCTHK
jgi:hypothetical protein